MIDKNITTILSSANRNNITESFPTHIIIDAKNLFNENKKILLKIGKFVSDSNGEENSWGILKCETAPNVTVGEIEDRMAKIATEFASQ